MDEFVGELLFQFLFQLFAALGAPVLDFLCRLLFWLVFGGVRTVVWLGGEGVRNAFCFYRDLWLRLRWRARRRPMLR